MNLKSIYIYPITKGVKFKYEQNRAKISSILFFIYSIMSIKFDLDFNNLYKENKDEKERKKTFFK